MMEFRHNKHYQHHNMTTYFYKLLAPRPTFPMDITEAEGAIMQQHFVYWRQQFEERKVIAYGPVMDPKGSFGIAVLETDDQSVAQKLVDNDPALTANAGFGYELHMMPDTIAR